MLWNNRFSSSVLTKNHISRMDDESEQFKLILVNLEDEHDHLKASVDHLKREITKREIEIQKLVAEKELELTREDLALKRSHSCRRFQNQDKNIDNNHIQSHHQYSSEFTKSIGQLLANISKNTEDISTIIKL